MVALLGTLPIHLAIQLVSPAHSTHENSTYVIGTPLPDQARSLPEGYTPFPDIGLAYKFFKQNLTWNAARKHCITEGGNLVVIDSFKKMDYANQVRDGYNLGPLVGIHKLFDDEEFVSSKTGLPLAFIPWRAVRNPNNRGKCGILWAVGMDTTTCDYPWVHMCEVPIFKPTQIQINIPSNVQLNTNSADLSLNAN